MNRHGLTVVLDVKLEGKQYVAAIKEAKGYVTRSGGTVTNIDERGKKRLAYEIQKMHEAYYYFTRFKSDSVRPNEVGARIRIVEPVTRYLCVETGV